MRNTAYTIILFSILLLGSCSKNESNQCRIGKINLISPKFNYSHDFDFIYDRNGELISTQRTAGLSKPKEIGIIEEYFLFKDERLSVKYEIILELIFLIPLIMQILFCMKILHLLFI